MCGLAHRSRYLPDRRDLNRCFPGSETGSLAARMAHVFMRDIVTHCTHGIDLHTGALHRQNLPQVRALLSDPITKQMAMAFGAPVMLQSELRELRPGDRKRLRQARLPQELAFYEAEVAGPCPFRAPALERLLDRLGALPDSRSGHGLRHRQRFLIATAAVCTLMGACGYRAFENTSKKFTQRQLRALGCKPDEEDGRYSPPSDSTFQRVLNKLDEVAVARIVGHWLAEQEVGALTQLAIDGKVLRGSGRHDGKPLQLLSAVTHQLRLTLDQIAIEEKSNEIPALKPLLKKLNLPPGTLITADAMHCQQESARCITHEWGGDYLFGLKGNQSGILEKAQRLLTQQGFPPSRQVGKRARTD
jgi:hypothetical protein